MISGAGTPTIENLVLTTANVEHVFPLNKGVKKLLLQCRNGGDLKIAFQQGESGTKFFTLHGFNTYYEDLITGPFTIAMQSPNAGTVVEIVTWYKYD